MPRASGRTGMYWCWFSCHECAVQSLPPPVSLWCGLALGFPVMARQWHCSPASWRTLKSSTAASTTPQVCAVCSSQRIFIPLQNLLEKLTYYTEFVIVWDVWILAYNLSSFYVSLLDHQQLIELGAELKEHCEAKASPFVPKVGEPCCAMFPGEFIVPLVFNTLLRREILCTLA